MSLFLANHSSVISRQLKSVALSQPHDGNAEAKKHLKQRQWVTHHFSDNDDDNMKSNIYIYAIDPAITTTSCGVELVMCLSASLAE